MSHEHAPPTVGAVAVDVGPGRGALIVRTGAERCGTELEISPAGDDGRRQHVWVLERATGAYAAVFGSLPAGEYTVWRDDGVTAPSMVSVREGTVVELDVVSPSMR